MTDTRIRTWQLVIPGRPALINAERSGHWHAHRRATREVREAAGWEARLQRIPALTAVSVTSWPTYTDRRWPDVGAWLPATKAAIDGLVDAGVLRGDGPTVVLSSTFLAPRLGETDALVVEIAGDEGAGR